MEFGMCTTGADDVVERAVRLEKLGFDVFGVGEHISFHLPASNPFVALAAAASVTSRLQLMTTVVLAPVYPAALLAKMGATLDQVSQGRFRLGVGVGGENPNEIEACGVPMSQRGRRADEVLDIVRLLWTEDHVDYDGRFATLKDITIRPKPVQRPHPPIWVSGRSDAAVRRAASVGDGWLPYLFTPSRVRTSLDVLRSRCGELGRDPGTIRSGAVVFVSCHRDPQVARELAMERLTTQYAQDFTDLLDKLVVHGSPQQVGEGLAEYHDAGVRTLIVAPACPEPHTEELENLLATEVIPELRTLASSS